jgi:2-amino-4-hydroxy-6-hydroxymethyldihydropteridine diphosphokinase
MSVLHRTIEAKAVIALGANLGQRGQTLQDAVREIADAEGVELTAVSSFYETAALKPGGVDTDAPAYLNAVALVTTTLAPAALLDVLHAIERAHGRERAERWGDRTLDLDIVDYAGLRSSGENLTLPHPRAHERDFVLRPWLEVDPDAALPDHGPVKPLLAKLDSRTLDRDTLDSP